MQKDCSLRNIPNLDCFTALLTLDLSCNRLTTLPVLSNTLEELIINDNRISEIPHELPNLLRFNGSDNVITKFNYPKNIERIHLKNNPISYIIKLDYLYFLDISKTKNNKNGFITEFKIFRCIINRDICFTRDEFFTKFNM